MPGWRRNTGAAGIATEVVADPTGLNVAPAARRNSVSGVGKGMGTQGTVTHRLWASGITSVRPPTSSKA